jgi:hypothetical protein
MEQFFTHINQLLDILTKLIPIVAFGYSVYLVLSGIIPVLYRLGKGLSKGKIAIFAEAEFFSLKSMILDSKIFRAKNIIQVHRNELRKAERYDLFLVHWKDYQTAMDDILRIKKDSIALIVYAPQHEGRIEDQSMLNRINNQRNAIIVNFRGRLLNDILISLITTSHERK